MKRILYNLLITLVLVSGIQAKTEINYLQYCTETVLEQIYKNDSLVQAGDVQNLNFIIDIRYEEFQMVDKLKDVTQLNDRLKTFYTSGYNPNLAADTKVGIYVILLSKQPAIAATNSYGSESKDELLALVKKYDKAKYQQYMADKKNTYVPGFGALKQYDDIWVQLCENIQQKLKEKQSITFNNNKGAVLNVTNFVEGRNSSGYPTIGRNASMLFGKKLSNESMLTVLKQTNDYLVGKKPTEYMPLYTSIGDYGFINLFLSGIEAGLNGIKNNPKLPGGTNAIADETGIDAENGMVVYPSSGINIENLKTTYYNKWNGTGTKPIGTERSYKNNGLIKYTDHAGILLADPTFLDRFFKLQDLSGFSLDDLKNKLPQGILFDDKITYKIIITSQESFVNKSIPTAIQQVAQAKLNNEDAVYIGLHIDFANSSNVQVYTTCTDKLLQKLKDYKQDLGYSWYRNKTSGKIVFAQGLQYKLDNFYTEWEVLGKYVATNSEGTKIYNEYSDHYRIYVAIKTYVDVAKPVDAYLETDEFAYIFLEGYAAVLMAPLTGGASLEAFAVRVIARKAAKDIAVGVALTISGKMLESYFSVDSIKTLKSAFMYAVKNANGQDYANNIIDEFQEGNPIPQYVNACLGKVHEEALSKAGYDNSEIPYDCMVGVAKKMFMHALTKAGGKTFDILKARIKGDPVTFMSKWKEFYGELTDEHIKSFEKVFGLDFDLKLKISQLSFDLSKYTNLKKAYTGFQSQLGSNYTTFENALRKCDDKVLTAFDNNTALFNKLGNIKDLSETELADRMTKVSQGSDFGALKFNNVLTKFINISSVSIPRTVDLSSYITQSDDLIDIVVHFQSGNYKALIEDNGKFVEKLLNTQDLAEIINNLPAGKAVRLLSCNDMASAKELSKLINNRILYASDGWVELFQDGTLSSQNAFNKILNGAETGDIGKYNSASKKQKIRLGGDELTNKVDDAVSDFYSSEKDPILTEIIEDLVLKNDYQKLSRVFGLDQTIKGKILGATNKSYIITASNIYKGEESGKFPAYKSIKYLNDVEREIYKVYIKDGELYTNGILLSSNPRLIFVMDEVGNIYSGVQKIGEFHHSSFLAGEDVATAGEFKFIDGILEITPSSGHYTPTVESLKQVLDELTTRGVDILKIKINRKY